MYVFVVVFVLIILDELRSFLKLIILILWDFIILCIVLVLLKVIWMIYYCLGFYGFYYMIFIDFGKYVMCLWFMCVFKFLWYLDGKK